jgi:hypothetical protein
MGEDDKAEVLFQGLFNQAQEAINKVYLPGTMARSFQKVSLPFLGS